jgi:RNA polymerase sigma factor (sigma-70 family)
VNGTDGRGHQGAGASRKGPSGDLVDLEEERKVIVALQSGDRSAFATLYGWYGNLLFRQVILPRLPIPELAQDCLKDTFRTALERIDTFRLENRSIFFWLRRIAANKAIDVHRRHRRDERLADQVKVEPTFQNAHHDRPDRGLEVDELRKMVDLSMSNLNARYAKALRMRLLEERTREECAEAMEVSVGNFDVILHRAAKAFRKVFPP